MEERSEITELVESGKTLSEIHILIPAERDTIDFYLRKKLLQEFCDEKFILPKNLVLKNDFLEVECITNKDVKCLVGHFWGVSLLSLSYEGVSKLFSTKDRGLNWKTL